MPHLEGRQSILAALHARQRRFEVILIRHGTHAEGVEEVIATAEQFGVPIRYVDGREIEAMAHGASHGGMLAVCSAKPRAAIDRVIDMIQSSSQPALLLLLEGVDDARNLGFTLRSAEAMGVHAVLIKKHLWDFDEIEVARPASGAYERMPLVQIDEIEPLRKLQGLGLKLIGCLANVNQTIYDADLTGPTILAIGGEKRGLSGAVRGICDQFVTIPTVSTVSTVTSLSLSHAGAIVMGEAMRQRRRTI
jgi:23S rRNA (guanosine2251-2'-O)-methyltransferase